MKQILCSLLAMILAFSSAIMPDKCDAKYTLLDNGNIVAPDGTEYAHLANEGFVTTFGARSFFGKVKGDMRSPTHIAIGWKTGMYSCEGDPDLTILVRVVPNNEWLAYYRKVSLPALDLSPDNCVRFEFVAWKEIIASKWYSPGVEHMTCSDGIKGKKNIKAFLADVRSQKSPEEAGLYDLVIRPDGRYENCYLYGTVYGYFKGETNLAIPFSVWSFNDKAYSIDLGNEGAFVLPDIWLRKLAAK